ncbi:MAG: DUF378 domain-containing protein [Patescibacteria group bacterium]
MVCEGGKKCCTGHWLAWILLLVGGLNWGLVALAGLFGAVDANWNVVNLLLGSYPAVENIVYLLVGLSAAMMIFGCRCKTCAQGGQQM